MHAYLQNISYNLFVYYNVFNLENMFAWLFFVLFQYYNYIEFEHLELIDKWRHNSHITVLITGIS